MKTIKKIKLDCENIALQDNVCERINDQQSPAGRKRKLNKGSLEELENFVNKFDLTSNLGLTNTT